MRECCERQQKLTLEKKITLVKTHIHTNTTNYKINYTQKYYFIEVQLNVHRIKIISPKIMNCKKCV